jgi:hypothetical protein
MHILKLEGGTGSASILAAAEGDKGPRKFAMRAYSGGEMNVYLGWQMRRVVVDIAGIQVSRKARPILAHHDTRQVVGHSTKVTKDGGALNIEGVVSGVGPAAVEVAGASDNGFPWQASVGLSVKKAVEYDEGKSVTVNGREFSGPIVVVRASTLNESSFVPLGADDDTDARMVASFEGANFGGLHVKKKPVEGGEMEEGAEGGEGITIQATATPAAPAAQQLQAAPAVDAVQVAQDAIKAERQRVAEIKNLCAGEFGEIEAAAIAAGDTAAQVSPKILEAMRKGRPSVLAIHAHGGESMDGATLEAAALIAGKLSNLEKHADAKALEAAHKQFKRGVSMQEMLLHAAWANGCNVRTFRENPREVMRFAFGDQRLQAAFSTVDIGGILSNVANKFMLESFNFVEQAWRKIAAIRNVSDFKTVTSYRMTGAGEYEKVTSGGEIRHGTLGEESFTNKADTYGKMLAITRQDIINDDMGALTQVPAMLGRMGALKLNKVFWTAFMDNASFFTGTGKYIDGATTVLGFTGLDLAVQAFLAKTDGLTPASPLGLRPSLLLVPPALETIAKQLFTSTEIRDTTASTKFPTANTFAGQYEPVCSQYLSDATITGYSSTAWYLLADPRAMATIEVAFLNGVETPTVETADADFNTLGIQMRAYHDFGAKKQDARGGVKSKGAQ